MNISSSTRTDIIGNIENLKRDTHITILKLYPQ